MDVVAHRMVVRKQVRGECADAPKLNSHFPDLQSGEGESTFFRFLRLFLFSHLSPGHFQAFIILSTRHSPPSPPTSGSTDHHLHSSGGPRNYLSFAFLQTLPLPGFTERLPPCSSSKAADHKGNSIIRRAKTVRRSRAHTVSHDDLKAHTLLPMLQQKCTLTVARNPTEIC